MSQATMRGPINGVDVPTLFATINAVDETRELGLAYNLLTPYTAFLAIPESELIAAGKQMLAAARGQRDEALAFNPDAAALQGQPAQAGDVPELSPPPPAREESLVFGGRGGCASCTVGETEPPGFGDMAIWLLLGVGLTRLRRRC